MRQTILITLQQESAILLSTPAGRSSSGKSEGGKLISLFVKRLLAEVEPAWTGTSCCIVVNFKQS